MPSLTASADNPFIMDQFTADPTARVFDGKIYVYPSHDIPPARGRGRANWFVMEDYHVFSSENLMDWKDHGVIVHQERVEWVNPTSYSMWAPDCIARNGKYYFYFPARSKDTSMRGSRIGVAVSDTPVGPFKPEPKPIDGVVGIDPNVFIDTDGQAYLLYSLNRIFIAKLKENMLELDSPPQVIELPKVGLIEGPFMFARNGTYYLTYPHVQNKTERLEYATGSSPMGPFKWAGVIMDESPTGCWTNHHSIIEYKGHWYLFYHHNDLSPKFDKNRSIRADYLYFNDDGSIQKVVPTLRGVGTADVTRPIQIDRYSATSSNGVTLAFLNEDNKHEGWKVALSQKDAWVQYNRVDLANQKLKSVRVRSVSSTGGAIEIRVDEPDGALLARVEVAKGSEWDLASAKLANVPTGVHNLVVAMPVEGNVELDWISFE
jgi:Glycosyl hydrolases family 43/Carbohydrate binding module (family 6)